MKLDEITVAILAGGQGSRLAGVLPEGTPKCMAPIGRGLFLDILLDQLSMWDFRRVHLCLGCGADRVSYAPGFDLRMEITRTTEPKPLGTAGALAFAAEYLRSDPVLVLNGDTLIDATGDDVSALCQIHQVTGQFATVGTASEAWCGLFVLGQRAIREMPKQGSLERWLSDLYDPAHYVHRQTICERFIDIGTPEAYQQADFIARMVSEAELLPELESLRGHKDDCEYF